jgi:integrase
MSKHRYEGVFKHRNKWYYRLQVNKKRVIQGGFDTATEASLARSERKSRLSKNPIEKGKIALRDFIIKYLTEHEKTHNRLSTFIKAESISRLHIVPELGHRKLQDLKTEDLIRFQNMLVRYKTPSVTHNTMRIMRRILNKAVEWGYIPYSPLKSSIPPPPKKEHPTLSIEQIHKLLNILHGRNKYVVALLSLGGLRRSEAFGLKWSDIDFRNKTLSVRRQHTQGRIEPVKTDESRATIPMCDDLVEFLRVWRLSCGSFVWIFPGKSNKPLSGEWWGSTQWPKIKKLYQFPSGFRIHDFRHSFATVLLELGIPIEKVQLLLRHKALKTTAELYRHVVPSSLKKEVSLLNFKGENLKNFSGNHGGNRNGVT